MLLFLVGLLSILCQVVLLRELNVAFYGVELVYLLGLATWMAGSAAGVVLGRRVRSQRAAMLLRGLLLVAAVLLPAAVAGVRAHRLALGAVPGAFLPFDQQLLVMAASLLPHAVAMGAAFRWASDEWRLAGGGLAAAYGVESLGAAAGGVAATAAIATGAGNLALAVATPIATGLVLAWRSPRGATGRRRLLLVAVALAAVFAPPLTARLDRATTRWTHPTLVEAIDSPYARLTLSAADGQASLFEDDVLAFESETTTSEVLAHMAALQHPSPRRMLLLGGAGEGIDLELAKHAPAVLDAVEIDARLLALLRRHGLLSLSAVRRTAIGDPRVVLSRAGQYDLIVVATPDPASGRANRLYTAEFYQECRRHLAAGGVLAFRLHSSENVLTPTLIQRTASIAKAIAESFAFVEMFAGSQTIVVASSTPLPADAALPSARLEERGIHTRLVTPAYLRYVYRDDRREDLTRRVRAAGVAANSDVRPACYQFASLVWLSRFFPGLVGLDVTAASDPRRWHVAAWLVLAVVLGAFAGVARSRAAARRLILAAVAGFVGMALNTVVLLAYQARSGALFGELALLVAAFMCGLAGGAWGMERCAGLVWCGPSGPLAASASGRTPRARTRQVLAALAVTSSLVEWLAGTSRLPGLAGAIAALVAVGALTAALLACVIAEAEGGAPALRPAPPVSSPEGPASRLAPRPASAVSPLGPLYAADLVGGCVAALLTALLLVPFFGLAVTSWLTAGLALLAAGL